MNEEILAKAKAAGSPEELLKLAHENGMSYFIEENANAYFNVLHQSGEIADEELENAAGGCRKAGHRVVSRGNVCGLGRSVAINGFYAFTEWKCKTCKEMPGAGLSFDDWYNVHRSCSCNRGILDPVAFTLSVSVNFGAVGVCGSCDWCNYVDGVWICTHPRDAE